MATFTEAIRIAAKRPFIFCIIFGTAAAQERATVTDNNHQAPAARATATTQPNEAADQLCFMIDGSRPMADVALAASRRYHVMITYEDPPYINEKTVRAVFPGSKGFVPQSHRLVMKFPADSTATQMLECAVDTYNRAYQDTQFCVSDNNGILNILPKTYLDNNGASKSYSSLLDTPVNLNLADGATCVDAMNAVFDVLKQTSSDGLFQVSNGPHRYTSKAIFPDPHMAGSARSVLNTAMASINVNLAGFRRYYFWQLWYGPEIVGTLKARRNLQFELADEIPQNVNLLHCEALRPMASAAELLEEHFHVKVTYEDPIYQSRWDVRGQIGTPQAFLSGGIVETTWTGNESAESVLTELTRPLSTDTENTMKQFAVRNSVDGSFHIYCTRIHNGQGVPVPNTSLLMGDVDPARLTGSIDSAMKTCVSQSETTLAETQFASDDIAKKFSQPCAGYAGAGSMKAVDALNYLAKTADPTCSWELQYDPATQKHHIYVYNANMH